MTAEGLKGCAVRTGQPAAALDPLTRTPRLAVMPFRKAMSAAQGCHLYFARRVTFLSCADTDFPTNHRKVLNALVDCWLDEGEVGRQIMQGFPTTIEARFAVYRLEKIGAVRIEMEIGATGQRNCCVALDPNLRISLIGQMPAVSKTFQ